jgi:Zn-dependent peptidase ImmA (M78 family)/DNA-binding XRE family transcriptional regulator
MGERIAEARGRAGLTQAELAAAISVPDRSAMTKIENGSRRVSALELAQIADALGERIEWFVTAVPESIVSHRNLQEPGAASPTIDRLAELAARNLEFLAEHDDRLMLEAGANLSRPATMGEAERAATEARELLHLADEEPLSNISERTATLGMFGFSFAMGNDAADAASILLATGGVAIVNGSLQVGRRRLAMAHELGRYLFADEYTVDWRVAEHSDDNVWESRLDRFARAMLLPPKGLSEMWTRLRSDDGDLRTAAVRTASAFRVDMSTLARRLRELALVDQSEANAIRIVRTTKADIVEFNLVVRDELEAPSLARRYEESVLRLYRREVVSAARATDLLFDTWSEDDLPVLPALPGSQIWNFVS